MRFRDAVSISTLTAVYAVCLASGGAYTTEEFPPAEKVFRYSVQADDHGITVYWNVAPGFYLYKNRLGVASATPGVSIGEPRFPKGKLHKDEFFGDQEIYRDDFTVTAPLMRTDPKVGEITLKLKLQGCADAGLCYPPAVWDVKVRIRTSVS